MIMFVQTFFHFVYFTFISRLNHITHCVKKYKMHRMAADSYMTMTKMPSANSCTAVYRKMNKTCNFVQKPYSRFRTPSIHLLHSCATS